MKSSQVHDQVRHHAVARRYPVNNAGITRDQLVLRLKARRRTRSANQSTSAYLCIQQVTVQCLSSVGDASSTSPAFSGRWARRVGELLRIESGLIGLTMAIARELGSREHYLQRRRPRFIETAWTRCWAKNSSRTPPNRSRSAASARLPRGQCLAFPGVDEASYITGHVLNVNGGC